MPDQSLVPSRKSLRKKSYNLEFLLDSKLKKKLEIFHKLPEKEQGEIIFFLRDRFSRVRALQKVSCFIVGEILYYVDKFKIWEKDCSSFYEYFAAENILSASAYQYIRFYKFFLRWKLRVGTAIDIGPLKCRMLEPVINEENIERCIEKGLSLTTPELSKELPTLLHRPKIQCLEWKFTCPHLKNNEYCKKYKMICPLIKHCKFFLR